MVLCLKQKDSFQGVPFPILFHEFFLVENQWVPSDPRDMDSSMRPFIPHTKERESQAFKLKLADLIPWSPSQGPTQLMNQIQFDSNWIKLIQTGT